MSPPTVDRSHDLQRGQGRLSNVNKLAFGRPAFGRLASSVTLTDDLMVIVCPATRR